MIVKHLLIGLLGLLGGTLLSGSELRADHNCASQTHDGLSYTVCTALLGEDDLRVFHRDPEGRPFGSFAALDARLAERGEQLGFAMNAGMYHPDRSAVGLLVDEGEEQARLITNPGPGNFGMQPNGVFCLTEDRALVVETLAFDADPPSCRFATQSGPMLVIDGALHPRFLVDSDSRFIRNGVGVAPDGQTVYFVISDQRVSFHEFGRFFRDALGTPNALFLDGKVSKLHAPDLGRSDGGFPMGPIVGTVHTR